MRGYAAAALFGALLWCGAEALGGQQAYFNPRDDQYRYLGMIRARAELRKATEDYDRAKALASKGMLSRDELGERRLAFERVRVDYLQQSLSTLLAAAHLVIEQAVKERRADGSFGLTVRLRNVSNQSAADAKARVLIDSADDAAFRSSVIPTVFVSLKSEGGPAGVTISKPYEVQVRDLRLGESRTVRFTLLKDVSDLVVATVYADKTEERRVWLDNAGAAGSTSLRATQFSLEGDFGAQVAFDLVLERTSMSNGALRLDVEGLPPSIAHEFRDPDTRARVVQVRVPDGKTTKLLQLVLTLPTASDGSVKPDVAVKFAVTAMPDVAPGETDARRTGGGRAEIELIPRGVSRVELRATSLYYESAPDDTVVTDVVVRNAGSRALARVAVSVEPASNWTARAEPAEIESLGIGVSRTVRISLSPRGSAAVGDYEHHLRVMSLLTDLRLDDQDRILRVRVSSRASLWATLALLGGLVAMTGGVVAGARKLSRR